METTNINETRRSFLKKVAYIAPSVVALGALSAPKSGRADSVIINVDGQTVNVPNVPATDPIGIWGH